VFSWVVLLRIQEEAWACKATLEAKAGCKARMLVAVLQVGEEEALDKMQQEGLIAWREMVATDISFLLLR
jgi:hypothetical protein